MQKIISFQSNNSWVFPCKHRKILSLKKKSSLDKIIKINIYLSEKCTNYLFVLFLYLSIGYDQYIFDD